MKYYHGTSTPDVIVNAIIGNGILRQGFHLTPSLEIARNYGSSVVEIEIESDLTKAHVGLINKDGNFNKNTGNGIEVVLASPAAINEFYSVVVDAQII